MSDSTAHYSAGVYDVYVFDDGYVDLFIHGVVYASFATYGDFIVYLLEHCDYAFAQDFITGGM